MTDDVIGLLPSLPKRNDHESPQVVLIMDRIRRDLDEKPEASAHVRILLFLFGILAFSDSPFDVLNV